MKELITGLALFILNLTAIGTALANADDLTNALDVICGPPINATFCSKVNAEDITPGEVVDFRRFLQSTEVGLVKSCTVLACCP